MSANESNPSTCNVGNDWVVRLARLQPWYLLTRYPNRLTRSIFAFVNASISIGIIGAAAVGTGQPLVYPSLGPCAFLFFYLPSTPASSPRNAILSHGAGILVGWMSFWLFAMLLGTGTSGAQIGSACLSLGLISSIMIAADIPHPPAASTTMVVSLGFMTDWFELIALMAAVVLLTAQAFAINRLSGVFYPFWRASQQHKQQEFTISALQTAASPANSDPYGSIANQLVTRQRTTQPDKTGRH